MARRRTGLGLALAAVVVGLAGAAASARADSIDVRISGIHAVPGRDYSLLGPPSMIGAGGGETVDTPVDLDDTAVWFELLADWYCDVLPTLPNGQTYTVVATTGGLSGTFKNAPEGATVVVRRYGHSWCWPEGPLAMELHYHETGPLQTATATVVNGSPAPVTSTQASASPWQAEVNQPVTVTATVDVSSGSTSGTISFSAARHLGTGRPLGCPSTHVVVADGAPATATCTADFSMLDFFLLPFGGAAPTATFTPDDTSTAAGSVGRDPVGVQSGTTTTTLSSSGSHALVATVTPRYAGSFSPTGSVQFLADGVPIPGCSAQPLNGSGSPTAACDACPLGPGLHQVTASYAGDANFAGSTSEPAPLAVAPKPSPGRPVVPQPAEAPPAHVVAPPGSTPRQVAVRAPARSNHASATRCERRRRHGRAHAAHVRRCTTTRARKHSRRAGG